MGGFSFENEVYVYGCNDFGTALVDASRYPASASFIDMLPFEKGVFVIKLGAGNSTPTFRVYQDTSATETASIKAITNASQVITATDDNKWLTIEFAASALDRDNDFRYVTVVCDGGGGMGGDDYASIMFYGFGAREQPVAKDANYLYHVNVAP